ncbi:MAG TPA: glutamate--tRNA ligase [Aestuariivirgaceae bacterium]|nr:glutamate--tRNA ligase [Aestuariivirgaceae bacterium]
MTTVVRFAPSPTGRIHIGNARTAILNWLFARKAGGRFVLRFDDTDVERSTEEFAAGIVADLAWLGIRPDAVERQSDRFARYGEAIARLEAAGAVYRAYETAEELDRRRNRQLARSEPPVYDRAALLLSDADRRRLEAEGRRPHFRFRLGHGVVAWDDLVRGPQHVDTSTISDPVLVREDGTYLYTLPSVVDDIDFGITHVIRGEDHVVNAAVQSEIFRALGASPPVFAHHSLLVGTDGKSLSKRLGSLSVAEMRAAGLEAMAVVSHAALIGTSAPVAPHARMEELVEGFDLSKLSRAPTRFDESELRHLNARLLHGLDYDDVATELADLGLAADAGFWEAVRGNLDVLADARAWHAIVHDELDAEVPGEDRALLTEARALLPPEPWDRETWTRWTSALKEKTGRTGKALFMPLRRALTGRDHGPELAALLPLIGRARTERRLA